MNIESDQFYLDVMDWTCSKHVVDKEITGRYVVRFWLWSDQEQPVGHDQFQKKNYLIFSWVYLR